MGPKRKCLPKNRRIEVWEIYIGRNQSLHLCLICNIVEMQQGRSEWHAAHVIPYSNGGGSDVDNLRPICSGCNLSMGDSNMIDYCKEYYPYSLNNIMNVTPQTGNDQKPIQQICSDSKLIINIEPQINNNLNFKHPTTMTDKCKYCNKNFSTKGNLKKHILQATFCKKLRNEEIIPDFECENCKKLFTSNWRLKNHNKKPCKLPKNKNKK